MSQKSVNEMMRMLETTCESIPSPDPTALTQANNSSALALVSFGHDICTSCKGTGRAPKHTNHQHDERTNSVDWSEYTDRNKRPSADVRKSGFGGTCEWKWCGVHKHWGSYSVRTVRFVANMRIRIYTRSDFRAPHIRDIRGPYS